MAAGQWTHKPNFIAFQAFTCVVMAILSGTLFIFDRKCRHVNHAQWPAWLAIVCRVVTTLRLAQATLQAQRLAQSTSLATSESW